MSDLLNQASLVMVPSGYKEDTVYSVVPSDGSGDLSFTRASNGTRINSAGLVEVTPWNLLQYSEDFSNSYWTKDNITLTSNATTNPVNGQNTATAIIATAVNTYHSLTLSSFSGSQPSVISIFVKAGSKSNIEIEFGSGQISFNLSTQTINYQTNATGTIENYGNGWYKISAIVPSCSYIAFIVMPGTGTGEGWTGDGTTTAVYYYGAQLNIGSTAKPYFPTTDRLNVPRLTYQNGGGGCPSLLLEKQSSNVVLYSEQFDQASWLKGNISITANNTTSPDGTQNADKITNTTISAVYLYQLSQTSATTWSHSIYAKKGTNKYFGISVCSETNVSTSRYQPVFNLDDGTLQTINQSGSNETNTSYSINAVGNGWYKITASFTFAGGSDRCYVVYQSSNNTNYNPASGDLDWANATTGDYYIWGAQLEAGAYPTSYIPTTSSSATRVADACFKTGISSLIGQTEGVLFVDVDFTHINSGSNEYLAQIHQDSNNRILLYRSSSNSSIGVVVLNAGGTIFSNLSSATGNTKHKVAIAYKSGDLAFYIDGVQIATNSTTFSAYSSLSKFDLGSNNQSGTPVEFGDYKYNEAIIFPTRLTNAELASLTTI